ncbi:MAG TPA: LD-carboxypeptidase [Chitinophagaceae bacterium]|nr:LD-carboxypeptidase [Chitinophagaceae bacterium]
MERTSFSSAGRINSMKSPGNLEKGAMIGITCPASKIEAEAAEYGSSVIQSWGFKIKMGDTLKGHFHNFSARDEQRRTELQEMLDDKNIRAIVFGRGGYGMLRILDQLDFSIFEKYPKWLCGYSDITALHLHVLKHCGIQTLHAVMVGGMTAQNVGDEYVLSLKNALLGKKTDYHFDRHTLNRAGEGAGQLIGGNLCLLAALCGSDSVPDMTNKILFIEDVGEYKYGIDRMMMTLKRAGWLDQLSGLIVGGFTNNKDTEEPFGQSVYELIFNTVKKYHYPIAFGFPVGHQKENLALKEGAVHRLVVRNTCYLKEV